MRLQQMTVTVTTTTTRMITTTAMTTRITPVMGMAGPRTRRDPYRFGNGCPGMRSYGCPHPGKALMRSSQPPIAG